MNRLSHVKATLPKNIQDNENYPAIEFVLLDYNSSDGLEEWVKSDLQSYINKGVLTYFKSTEPTSFHRSHSRNIMFRLATGDIVCNVDADNFIGKNFAGYINNVFVENERVFLCADTTGERYYIPDVFGRFCVKKEDFINIGGYDEDLSGYGYEDIDLYTRIKMLGRQEVVIEDTTFLKYIPHTDKERVENEYSFKSVNTIFLSHVNYCETEILLLFEGGKFEMATLIDANTVNSQLLINLSLRVNPTEQSFNRFYFDGNAWQHGEWSHNRHHLTLKFVNKPTIILNIQNSEVLERLSTDDNSKLYSKVENPEHLKKIILMHCMLKNKMRMTINLNNKRKLANNNGFGKGIVFKNFDYSNPLRLQ